VSYEPRSHVARGIGRAQMLDRNREAEIGADTNTVEARDGRAEIPQRERIRSAIKAALVVLTPMKVSRWRDAQNALAEEQGRAVPFGKMFIAIPICQSDSRKAALDNWDSATFYSSRPHATDYHGV